MNSPRLPFSILCVDDEPPILSVLRKLLEEDYYVYTALNGLEALNILNDHEIAVALVDQKMPNMTGIELLTKIKDLYPNTVRIILTAHTEVHDLVDSINVGEIFRHINKPWEADVLADCIREAVQKFEHHRAIIKHKDEYEKLATEKADLEREIVLLKSEIEKEYSLDNIVSISPEMNNVRRLINAASLSDETVLVQGESGTGKELVARAIHYNSKRHHKKFLAVDCGALTETLLEGELFGHKKGAFTGAVQDQKGLIEDAVGGTVFLDEISNTSLSLQAKLLRVIQEKEIRRVGETQYRQVDVRIIAATNKDLLEEVQKQTFRMDLYYRLNVLNVLLPALRDRRSDIPLLINHIISEYNQKSEKKIKSISRDALNLLSSLPWNGNIRELKNIINRMIIFAHAEHLDIHDIPDEIRTGGVVSTQNSHVADASGFNFSVSAPKTMDELEKEYISFILSKTSSNKAEAAKLLGLKRTTLIMRMKKLGL
ncbi:sigma-54-dependent Fis family transcriptional regulator [bacterium]|nr:sigma-54-dependent Fis family transcriptional regulator [bacterium]